MSQPSGFESESSAYDISTVNLDDDRYEVTQSVVRNKYAVRDSAGNVVLRGKQKMFKLKEEFPFVTGDDDDAFSVKAGGIMDIAGNYAITDAGTGEEVVVLDEDYSLLAENWTIRDPDTGRRWRPFARRINCSLRSATSSPLRTSFRTSTRYSTPTATTSATSREVLAARRLHGHYRRRERRAEGGGNRLRVRPRRLREPVATRVVFVGNGDTIFSPSGVYTNAKCVAVPFPEDLAEPVEGVADEAQKIASAIFKRDENREPLTRDGRRSVSRRYCRVRHAR